MRVKRRKPPAKDAVRAVGAEAGAKALAAASPIRVLVLEDSPSDAELMVDALRQAGFDPKWERVETEAEFASRLTPDLDLILSDYGLPKINGLDALRLARSRGLDVPFILVSGSIGEDVAVAAMREGALYDLLGRFHHKDMRDRTIAQFMQRYHVDALQARRVGTLAFALLRKLKADPGEPEEAAARHVAWAAKLHEIGISVAYGGYHRHSAYIVANADMPGFSRDEQSRLSLLVRAHRRSLNKVAKEIEELGVGWDPVFALRLAALIYRSRADVALPSLQAKRQGRRFRLAIGAEWLRRNPLTATALREEVREWDRIGFELRIPELEAAEAECEVALVG